MGRVPLLHRYYQGATTSCRSSRRTSFPSLGGTADGRLQFRFHRRQATNACRPEHIGHPVRPHIPGLRAETTGSPTFLGNPHCAYALLVDPGRTDHTRPFSVRRHGPRSDHDEGSRGNVSRGSITQPGHSLSTLRRMDYSTTTQDSLPAAGQALPDGLSTRRVPTKGFRANLLHGSFSFPKPRGAKRVTLQQPSEVWPGVTNSCGRLVDANTLPIRWNRSGQPG